MMATVNPMDEPVEGQLDDRTQEFVDEQQLGDGVYGYIPNREDWLERFEYGLNRKPAEWELKIAMGNHYKGPGEVSEPEDVSHLMDDEE